MVGLTVAVYDALQAVPKPPVLTSVTADPANVSVYEYVEYV